MADRRQLSCYRFRYRRPPGPGGASFEKVALHADLTMLGRLGQALLRARDVAAVAAERLYRAVSEADYCNILVAILIGAGFVLGLILGRWWALLACIGVGVWIGLSEEVEVPGWFLGAWYAAVSGVGVAAGVLLRRYFVKPS